MYMSLQYWISRSTLQLFSTGRTPKGSRARIPKLEKRRTGLDFLRAIRELGLGGSAGDSAESTGDGSLEGELFTALFRVSNAVLAVNLNRPLRALLSSSVWREALDPASSSVCPAGSVSRLDRDAKAVLMA
jgi:hypothetical protein